MKKNHLMIGATIIIVSLAAFLLGKEWLNKPEKSEIQKFLQTLAEDIQAKPTDTVLLNFDVKQPTGDVIRVINLLAGKTAINGKSKSLFTTTLNILDAEIAFVNERLSNVTIPITFRHKKLPDYEASLKLEIVKDSEKHFKITAFNGEELFSDYVAFENAIKTKMFEEDEIFSPETLLAFKTSEQLKSKYDSVLWFSYIGNETYYYVVNGKWEVYDNLYNKSADKKHQIGLVNSELKEIIPAEYDLIHNIGGTFEHLVEVEKEGKKGFFNLEGKIVIPVIHDQIIPVEDSVNLGIASIGSDYFWIRKDFSLSEKDSSIRITDILKKVTGFARSSTIRGETVNNLLEFNSREHHAALYLAPSYLVDWKLLPVMKQFKNPRRKKVEFYDISSSVELQFAKRKEASSWVETIFYSIRDNYIGGRSDFYESKNVLMVDSKNNKVYGYQVDSEFASEKCNEFNLKALADTLFELKTTEYIDLPVGKKYLVNMPVYHYLSVRNAQLEELPSKRKFSFTKYTRLNDSYLQGCFIFDDKQIDKLPAELLSFMKMEIYAEYDFNFPDEKWRKTFTEQMDDYTPKHSDVDSYLTDIDRYNISWLNQRLKEPTANKLVVLK